MITIPTPRDIRVLELDASITIAEACRRAGVGAKVFSGWELGKTDPKISNVSKIVAELQKALRNG